MIRYAVLTLTVFICAAATAQNLVPNPSFEEVVICPTSFYEKTSDIVIPGWTSASMGTPDLFHSCSQDDAGVPFNWAGESNSHSGKGYAGVYVWDTEPSTDYREYLQSELSEPLKPGEKYTVEFYYKSAPSSVYVVNRIGLALSTTPVKLSHDKLIGLTPALSVNKEEIKVATAGDWELASMTYEAKGGERYIIIGNFFSNADTKTKRLPWRFGKSPMLGYKSYYYIDDVSVKRAVSAGGALTTPAPDFKLGVFNPNVDYTIRNITFEFDSHLLLRQSFVELDKIAEYLSSHPEVHIRLVGHVDFAGTDELNLTLSRNRARSVADHFISKGVSSDRIITYGFGKSRPVVLSKTDKDREANRRIEIRFVTLP